MSTLEDIANQLNDLQKKIHHIHQILLVINEDIHKKKEVETILSNISAKGENNPSLTIFGENVYVGSNKTE